MLAAVDGGQPTASTASAPLASPASSGRGRALGLLLMLGSVVAFTVMGALVKDLREHGMGTFATIVWRTAPGLPFVALELHLRRLPWRPRRPRVVALRTVFGALAMTSNFWAVQSLALVQHTVVHLLQPVAVAIFSPLLLRERLRGAAVAALGLALAGSLVVLVPPDLVSMGSMAGAVAMPLVPGLVGVSSAFFSALAHIQLRLAAGSDVPTRLDPGAPPDAPETVVFHFTFFVSILAAAIGLALGEFSSLPVGLDLAATIGRVSAMALAGLAGQLMMSRAYARVEAPTAAIVAYAAIPLSAAIDAFVWGAPVGITAWIGAAAMVLAGALLSSSRPSGPESASRPSGPESPQRS
jgi:drug/metabolite transporter (DMT)-like permease